MDSTLVKRCAKYVQDSRNSHFKPLWEPDTTIGRNAIKYSLAHHAFQQRISSAGMCRFCMNELTRRVSEVARRFRSQGLFHDDSAFMDLFWQDEDENDGAGLVAGETIVVFNKDGEKVSVADHAIELCVERSADWWEERSVRFKLELAAMDRSDAIASRGPSLAALLGSRVGGYREATPWETRWLGVFLTFTRTDMSEKVSIKAFVEWNETYLNFTHENCQCVETLRLKNGASFETVLMERLFDRISPSVWEVIPQPSEDIWSNKDRLLTYFADQDYAYSRGEVNMGDNTVPGFLPQGWQRRRADANTEWYYDCHGRLISRRPLCSRPPNAPSAADSSVIDEEDLIEL